MHLGHNYRQPGVQRSGSPVLAAVELVAEVVGCPDQRREAVVGPEPGWATEHVPLHVAREQECQAEYYARQGRSLLADYLSRDMALEERLVCNGQGFTNLEVVETARRVTGHPIPHRMGPRRPGDRAVLVASSDVIRHELGWKPRYPALEQIIGSAWEWHSRNPNGYTGWSRALEEE